MLEDYRVNINIIFCDPVFAYFEPYNGILKVIGVCKVPISYPDIYIFVNFTFRFGKCQ